MERICSIYLENSCRFEVVDLAENPERAQMDCILATPTLLRLQPMPESRIIGDLSKTSDVLAFLDIDPKK
jgi:circadian clock protein KaiB